MRKVLKSFIYFFGYLFERNQNSKIVYYHDVSRKYTTMGTDLELIRRHFDIARQSGFDIVDKITQQKGQIMVCFDDGWAGIYEAKDFFIKEEVFPTIFIAVALIGRPGYLTIEQILEMQSLGFHFEGHTWSHEDLTTFSEKGLQHELKDSKDELSRLLCKEVTALCFPKGRFSDKVFNASIAAGYTMLYSSINGGYYDLLESKKLICRNLVQIASLRDFKYIICSSSKILRRRAFKLHFEK